MYNETFLQLEDGMCISGEPFGAKTEASGEVVFTTGMVGYPEMLTDPSFSGQILVMTYPLAGNYGVPQFQCDQHGLPLGFESRNIQISGLVVSEHCAMYSHANAVKSLSEWLAEYNIPAISGIDTRALTKRLRTRGTMLGKITSDSSPVRQFYDPNITHLVSRVSPRDVTELRANETGSAKAPRVVVVDCGCKANIVRNLLFRGLDVVRVPHDHYFPAMDFDGLVISNGPGDPQMCRSTIKNIERALALGKPILGICLGNQLLALAAGGETYKLKYGHRGQNQPCIEIPYNGNNRQRVVLTSQNHGFAVRPESLPEDWRVWFTNANDGTVEGIRHVSKPFFAVQFHPEACPGPVDCAWIFDDMAAQVIRSAGV